LSRVFLLLFSIDSSQGYLPLQETAAKRRLMTAKFCVFAKQNTEQSEVNKIRTKLSSVARLLVSSLVRAEHGAKTNYSVNQGLQDDFYLRTLIYESFASFLKSIAFLAICVYNIYDN